MSGYDYDQGTANSLLEDADEENRKLSARIAELEQTVERIKSLEDSALKVCGQLDEIVMVMPYDYLDPPDGGNVSMAEQVKRMYSEVKILRNAVQRQERCDALEQLAKDMSEALAFGRAMVRHPDNVAVFDKSLSRYREVCGG